MASPIRFTVSQVRVAATCPRILYFDAEYSRSRNLKQPRVTRIWKEEPGGKTTTALGTLFHNSVEKFNSEAARSADLKRLLETVDDSASLAQELQRLIYVDYVKLDRLFMAEGPQQKHFMDALTGYAKELADVLVYGIHEGLPVDTLLDQMFGDQRRKVDVTFHVGPDDTAINVSGVLDYLFYDWRRGQRRIIDYKLAPGDQPSMDLYQVCVYALMHHMQHGTEPDVGVLYLHPRREMKEMTWEQVYAQRHNVYDLLASMAAWVQYDEKTAQGLKPPGEPVYCAQCCWSKECVNRLGPTNEGRFLHHWRNAFHEQPTIEPRREVHEAQPGTARGAPARVSTKPAEPGQLEIGTYPNDQSPSLLPVSVLTNHVAVVGASGSGKTYMAKVIVEEAVRQRIPVLAIDPQGDLVQFLKPSRIPEPSRQDSFNAYWSAVEPRILTPGSSHGIRIGLNPLRLPADEDLANLSEARRKEELNGMLAATAANLVNMARAGGDTELQQTYLMQVLRKLINRSNRPQLDLETIAEAANDPESLGLDDADDYLPKTQRRRLGQKFKALLHGPYANLFRGGRPFDLDELCRGTEDGKTPLNVVYLNALGGDDQKQSFLAALATEVYRWMVSSLEASGRVNLLFYLDEARDFIPKGNNSPATKDPLIRLFTQGRKYGVACLMCTQSPRSVDYNVFGNCSTKFIGRLASAQDVDRVAEWFSDGARPDWLADRKNALAGTFVGRWPGMAASAEGRSLKSRSLFSVHESAWSPDRVEQEVIERTEIPVAFAAPC